MELIHDILERYLWKSYKIEYHTCFWIHNNHKWFIARHTCFNNKYREVNNSFEINNCWMHTCCNDRYREVNNPFPKLTIEETRDKTHMCVSSDS